MNARFELFIAARYLRARRKEAAISLITAISVVGVAAGVMAMVIALAVTNGFRNTLQRSLTGAMAHVNIVPKQPGDGIENWQELAVRLRRIPHVAAVSPVLYQPVFITGALQQKGAYLKGVEVDAELSVSTALRKLKQGSLDRMRDPNQTPPCIILGSRLVQDTGMTLNSIVQIPSELLTPMAPRLMNRPFRVCGVFETGFYDIDDNWAYAAMPAVQKVAGTDAINQMEINADDPGRVEEVARAVGAVAGSSYTTTTWMEKNGQLLNALKMERTVTIVVIGLIELVAALNIFITLVMMVMEKYRDIAVLMSLGARYAQIRRIFMLQGVLIGVAGSAIGLILGYSLSYLANAYRWLPLEESVYSMSFVPFEPRPLDGLWIAAAAILVSFVATIYPARNATRISPVEVLRYE